MTTVSPDELKKVPYLDVGALSDRTLNLMPFWDGKRWCMWTPTGSGLFELHPVGIHASSYIAAEAAHANDIVIPFLELMWQRASWDKVCTPVSALAADFGNFGTCIEKLTHYFTHRDALGMSAAEFVKTELEYLLMLSRSVFDLLQEAVAYVWNTRVRLNDQAAEATKKHNKLPEEFRKVVIFDERGRTADELIQRYALTPLMAAAYASTAPFFSRVRRLRDDIVHLGKDPRMLFSTQRGFCIPKSAYGFGNEPFWRPEHRGNDNIVSLLPLVAHVVIGTIDACSGLVVALASEIPLPRPIAPGFQVFLRGPHNEALLWILDVAKGYSGWWSGRPAWKRERIETRAYFHWHNRTGTAWEDEVSNWRQAEAEFGPQVFLL